MKTNNPLEKLIAIIINPETGCLILAMLFAFAAGIARGQKNNMLVIADAIKIKITAGSYSDETVIRFLQGATTGFDGSYDAWKLFSPSPAVPAIFTKYSTGNLSINALPALTASRTEAVYLKTGTAGTYSISAEETGAFSSGVSITLKDMVTGNTYNLRTSSTYTFSLPVIAATDPARFAVLFSLPAYAQTTDASCGTCVNGLALVIKPGETGWFYSVNNSASVVIASGLATTDSITVSGLAAGTYSIHITNSFGTGESLFFTIAPPTYYSRTNGNWNDPSTWSKNGCGGAASATAPGEGENIVICSGNTVTANTALSIRNVSIDGGTLTAAASFSVTGNWTNNGTFTPGTQTVSFSGNSLQLIGGTVPTAFNSIYCNNSAPGEAVRLNSAVSVNGTLTLKDGHITTTALNLLTCNASASVVLNANPQDSSFIKGPLAHKVGMNSGVTKVFPVGKGNSYRRIDLTIDQKNNTLTSYTVELINNSAADLGYSLPATISNVSGIRYHEIRQSPSTALDMAQVRIYFGCAGTNDMVENLPAISIAQDNGANAWLDRTDTPSGYTCSGNTYWGNSLSGSFTSFAGTKFALTNTGEPAPLNVSLKQFAARYEENRVSLTWTTSSETNSDFFLLERSADGIHFEALEKIQAAGQSSSEKEYKTYDIDPAVPVSYYRLTVYDKNGQLEYSPVVLTNIDITARLSVYPNPAAEYCKINISGHKDTECSLNILDITGKVVHSENIIPLDENESITLALKDKFSPGIYFVSILSNNLSWKEKIIVY